MSRHLVQSSRPAQRARAPALTKPAKLEGATHSARPVLLRLPFDALSIAPPKSREPPARHGLPQRLKAGIEALSGVSMDGVTVRYNSPHPGRIDALAFARSREIHLAAGQERHLPHEAWHLVQQARGRVRPTGRVDGVALNEDPLLEREADTMGDKAARLAATGTQAGPQIASPEAGRAHAAPSSAPEPLQARGSRGRRRKRWQAIREGRPKPRSQRIEPERNLADLGDKHVTVYRVEHDAKPAILAPKEQRQQTVDSKLVAPHLRKPTQNLKPDAVPDSVHWISLDTPARAIANWRQRVGNQLAAPGPRTLPADRMPKLKSFKIPNEIAKKIQRDSVLEHESAASPNAPINSDQNYAPNQFGVNKVRFEAIAKHAVKNSYMEYDQSDLATLQSIHGSGKSADDHHRHDPYPSGLRKELKSRRGRGSGKRSAQQWRQPYSYDRSKDPFEGRERDRDLDPEARTHLWRNRRRTLADFLPPELK